MHIIASLVPFIVMVNWLAGVILFERLYARGSFREILEGYSKSQCCKVWVIGETFLYLLCGYGAFMFALLMLWTIGVSHFLLCGDRDSVITVVAVIKNVPSAIKKAAAKISPYIK